MALQKKTLTIAFDFPEREKHAGPVTPGLRAFEPAHEITNTPLAQTPEGRQLLEYLISCALPTGRALYTLDDAGKRHDFMGQIGLAPGWADEGLTATEQRWVSACILARTNKLGLHVLLSMRSTPPIVPFFDATPTEKKAYCLHEGGFFGNIFSKNRVAYVRPSKRAKTGDRDAIFEKRVCALPSGKTTPVGEPLSQCDFIMTDSNTVAGQAYAERIDVYLKPVAGCR